MSATMIQWQMIETGKAFQRVEVEVPPLKPNEVLVKIAGCGVCHTDLSFWYHGVQTRHALPLTLGHEISGVVVAGDEAWLNKNVIIPAVLPCGECELCRTGRSNVCREQRMPGNDFHGGFATHIVVPSRTLCEVPDRILQQYSLSQLAVIADAVSTPYQVLQKSELRSGDLAIMIGVGGIGIYAALIAKSMGAKVLALDISDEKLLIARENGVDATINIHGLDIKTIKDLVKKSAKELAVQPFGWKIFELSGTKNGQELGFALITYASTMSVVGFTMDKIDLRLSNLMAFDAKLIGTWGCRAELYPQVLDLVANDTLSLHRFVQTFPLSDINNIFEKTRQHTLVKRSVLVPDENLN